MCSNGCIKKVRRVSLDGYPGRVFPAGPFRYNSLHYHHVSADQRPSSASSEELKTPRLLSYHGLEPDSLRGCDQHKTLKYQAYKALHEIVISCTRMASERSAADTDPVAAGYRADLLVLGQARRLEQMLEESCLELPVTVNRHGYSNFFWGLCIDMVAAVDSK